MHYYQFNIADYRKDTAHLTPMEHYIYRQLIDWYYLDEQPIPKITQVVMRRLSLGSEHKATLENVLHDFFENDENGWTGKVQAAALHILSAATQVASDGIQVLGGVGYMKDFGQEKRFRDIGQIQAFLGYFPLKKIHFIKQLM